MADPHAVTRWARSNQREFLLRDFFTFAKYSGICPDIEEDPYREVCDWLESRLPNTKGIAAWRERRKRTNRYVSLIAILFGLFLMPRLTFKTSLISALCIFAICVELSETGLIDIRMVLGRATTTMAEATLDGIKTEIERNSMLNAAFGNLRGMFGTWTSEKITASQRSGGLREPTIDTTGLNTSKTGAHPDFVILDDLVHELNYESAVQMETARKLVQAFYPILERGGSLLIQGTRWGDNDVYGFLMERDDKAVEGGKKAQYERFIWGAYKDDEQTQVRFPTVLPEARIAQLRDSIDPKMFAAWILNVARAEGEDIFTLAYVRYFEGEFVGGPFAELQLEETGLDGKPVNLELRRRFGTRIPLYVVMLIDPAPTVGKKSDFTGVVVLGFDPDANYWVLGAWEIKLLPTQRLAFLLARAQQFSPRLVAIENADIDAVLLQEKLRAIDVNADVVSFNPRLDRRKITASEFAPRGHTKKEAQIEGMEPTLRANRVFFDRRQTAPLVRQLTKYPYLDHDDVLDAFSMSKAYEQRAVVEVQGDPDKVFLDLERREYELERLDEDGNELDVPRVPSRPRASAGMMAGRLPRRPSPW